MESTTIKDAIEYFLDEGFINELTTDKRFYTKALILAVDSLTEERDMLAYENKAMAERLIDQGFDPSQVIMNHRDDKNETYNAK
jgi:hypothetical protein